MRDLRVTLDAVLSAMLEFRDLATKGDSAFGEAVETIPSWKEMTMEDKQFAHVMFTFGYSRGVREVVEATNNAIEASKLDAAVITKEIE